LTDLSLTHTHTHTHHTPHHTHTRTQLQKHAHTYTHTHTKRLLKEPQRVAGTYPSLFQRDKGPFLARQMWCNNLLGPDSNANRRLNEPFDTPAFLHAVANA